MQQAWQWTAIAGGLEGQVLSGATAVCVGEAGDMVGTRIVPASIMADLARGLKFVQHFRIRRVRNRKQNK